MSKIKDKVMQRLLKMAREAHLSPEMKASFRAINRYVDDYYRCKAKARRAIRLTQDNRMKLVKLSESQNHRCCYCGCDTWHPNIIDYKTHRSRSNKATIEHLLPRSQGGTYRWENIAMACSECNIARGDLPLEEFLASIQTEVKPEAAESKAEIKKDASLEMARQLKKKKGDIRRFQLFMTASWMFPEDYKYAMENIKKGDARIVFKGGKNPSTPRNHLMKKIRSRVQENRMAA